MTGSRAGGTIDRRIFVVGVPRSGTTLLQSLLAAHGSLTSFTESHFFDRHFARLPVLGKIVLRRDPGPRVREFLAENGEAPCPASEDLAKAGQARWRLPLRTRTVGRGLLALLDELAFRRGRSAWVEKTPRHLHVLDFIEGLAASEPRLDFVHVLREGLEVVASLRAASQSWERPYDLATCVARWNSDLALSWERRDSARDHFVFYEDLAASPETTLKRLLSSLDLPWEESLFDDFSKVSEGLVTGEEAGWKHDVGRAIRPSSRSDRLLTAEERETANRALRREPYEGLRSRAERAEKPAKSGRW